MDKCCSLYQAFNGQANSRFQFCEQTDPWNLHTVQAAGAPCAGFFLPCSHCQPRGGARAPSWSNAVYVSRWGENIEASANSSLTLNLHLWVHRDVSCSWQHYQTIFHEQGRFNADYIRKWHLKSWKKTNQHIALCNRSISNAVERVRAVQQGFNKRFLCVCMCPCVWV